MGQATYLDGGGHALTVFAAGGIRVLSMVQKTPIASVHAAVCSSAVIKGAGRGVFIAVLNLSKKARFAITAVP